MQQDPETTITIRVEFRSAVNEISIPLLEGIHERETKAGRSSVQDHETLEIIAAGSSLVDMVQMESRAKAVDSNCSTNRTTLVQVRYGTRFCLDDDAKR